MTSWGSFCNCWVNKMRISRATLGKSWSQRSTGKQWMSILSRSLAATREGNVTRRTEWREGSKGVPRSPTARSANHGAAKCVFWDKVGNPQIHSPTPSTPTKRQFYFSVTLWFARSTLLLPLSYPLPSFLLSILLETLNIQNLSHCSWWAMSLIVSSGWQPGHSPCILFPSEKWRW